MSELEWWKSSRPAGQSHCVEIAFVKAKKSAAAGHCVEVAMNELPGSLVFVRDSKDAAVHEDHRIVLSYTQAEWMTYLQQLKMGHGAIINEDPQCFVINQGTKCLAFTSEEWAAFMSGVGDGEFDLPRTEQAYTKAEPVETGRRVVLVKSGEILLLGDVGSISAADADAIAKIFSKVDVTAVFFRGDIAIDLLTREHVAEIRQRTESSDGEAHGGSTGTDGDTSGPEVPVRDVPAGSQSEQEEPGSGDGGRHTASADRGWDAWLRD